MSPGKLRVSRRDARRATQKSGGGLEVPSRSMAPSGSPSPSAPQSRRRIPAITGLPQSSDMRFDWLGARRRKRITRAADFRRRQYHSPEQFDAGQTCGRAMHSRRTRSENCDSSAASSRTSFSSVSEIRRTRLQELNQIPPRRQRWRAFALHHGPDLFDLRHDRRPEPSFRSSLCTDAIPWIGIVARGWIINRRLPPRCRTSTETAG